MSQPHLRRRLTPMDAFFLYIEREEQPMSVGCVATFEGAIPFRAFVRHIESRLHRIPRYRQRVVPCPLNVGLPTWEADPDFDIRNHIFCVKLDAPGTDIQLRKLAEELFEGTLDRDKPLWEIYLVSGLEGGRTGMFTKVHHCMIDGIAGVELLMLILDASPETRRERKRPYRPKPIPSAASRLYDALWDNAADGVEHWTHFQRGLAAYLRGQDRAASCESLGEFLSTIGNLLSPIQRLPFNTPLSGRRRLAYGNVSLSEAQTIHRNQGCTINDVVLTALCGAVRRYLRAHDERMRRTIRVMVPVNLRRKDERGDFGNRITFLPVEIPLNILDPLERLRRIHRITAQLKAARVPEAIDLMFNFLQGSPPMVQSVSLGTAASRGGQLLLGLASQVPPLHLICTNVPGPQIPLYALGRRLETYHALLPVALEMGVSFGIISYDQRLFVSVIGDGRAISDPALLLDGFMESFVELREAAEIDGHSTVRFTKRASRPVAARKAVARRYATSSRKPATRKRRSRAKKIE